MIRFLLNQEVVTLDAVSADVTVLQWLREHRHKTGTKEGCGSGDCGACTVVLASLNEHNGEESLIYESANSCITFIGAIHGKQLITVEDLATGVDLHPVQQAMVDAHGSQCGFCTPGFIMSMFALFHHNDAASFAAGGKPMHKAIERALGGNLCRCTGYAPIVRATEKALQSLGPDSFDDAQADTIASLKDIQQQLPMAPRFMIPGSAEELGAMRIQYPDARLLGGGTDLALEVTQQLNSIDEIIHVSAVPELHSIKRKSKQICIGAAVSLNRFMQELTAIVPGSETMMLRFGSEQVRNQGTVGGNIANASPVGDLPPLLLVLDASIELQHGASVRSISIADFFIDYKQTAMLPNEFIASVTIPVPDDRTVLRVYKISKRMDDDISSVLGVFSTTLIENVISEVRVAYGGMAAIPKRALNVEAAIVNRSFNEATVSKAIAALADDFSPISDARASAQYRQRVAANLLKRFWLDASVQEPMLQVGDYVGG